MTRVRAHVDSLEVGMGKGHEAAPTSGSIVSCPWSLQRAAL